MKYFDYLIIGGGMTAASAVEGIRSVDSAGLIGILGEETYLPYNRPPLSKGLWKGKPLEKIWRKLPDHKTGFLSGIPPGSRAALGHPASWPKLAALC